jgi:hypothetical protein
MHDEIAKPDFRPYRVAARRHPMMRARIPANFSVQLPRVDLDLG